VRAALPGLNVPSPPDQVPEVAPIETDPLRATVALLIQTEISGPIATTGAPVNIIFNVSTAWLQVPLLVELKIRLATPAASSDALGVYVPFNAALFGLKDPAAPLQIPVVVGPVTKPDKDMAALFLQTVKLKPASTAGALVKLITSAS